MIAQAKPSRIASPLNFLLALLLVACVVRMWLVPLTSSLWVDELVTTFVVRYPAHPSFAIAPQVPESIYYWLPRVSTQVFGSSEAAWRIPSVLTMLVALWLIARLARRLIHEEAGWFAVFACLAIHGINYFAIDARPYALGMAVSAASVLFLARWFDRGRWIDALLFTLFAALLWRVHLLYWPFYLVYAIYAAVRIAKHDTAARAGQIIAVVSLVGVSLVPVALRARAILHGAESHVFAAVPTFHAFEHMLHWNLAAQIGLGAWLVALGLKWSHSRPKAPSSSLTLVLAWWLVCPVCLYLYSLATHNSVLVPRYVSLLLPGAALAATLVAGAFVPRNRWKHAAVAVGIGALIFEGQWSELWLRHDHSDWRAAAAEENRLVSSPGTPVICPSAFIEARTPAWTPDYPLPGFLYAQFLYYPVSGDLNLFPYDEAPEAKPWAASLLASKLAPSGRFILYGPASGVRYWYKWFGARAELAGWNRNLEEFGDIYVGVFSAK